MTFSPLCKLILGISMHDQSADSKVEEQLIFEGYFRINVY